jgi:carbamoyltransferase
LDETVDLICRGALIGWFQDGAELGPRALGQRSIVCDPRVAANKDALNARVKKRESFRPFAPAILEEHARDWFEIPASHGDNPFMLRVYPFRRERRDLVPAVVHVDGTGRVQTVSQTGSPSFYRLIEAYYRRTGVPILLNTSMNVMGEPIVETIGDALVLLLTSGLDACAIGSRLVTKQNARTSLLEFGPFLIAESVATRHVVNETGVGGTGGGIVECRVHTPWGADARSFPSDCLPVVGAIDGHRTGVEIVSLVENDPGVCASRSEDLLYQLTRQRVVWWRP